MSTRQLIIIGAFALLIGAFVGARFISSQKKPAERTPTVTAIKSVKTRLAENETVSAPIAITGRLAARQKIELYAEVGGVLASSGKAFKEGNYFKKGEALVRIADDEFTLNILAQKSSLQNQIILLLPDLKLDYPESYQAWKTYVDKFEVNKPLKPLPSPQNDQEKYFIGARNLNNLFYTIKSQEARASKYTIRAPFSGVVTESGIDPGTLVRTGQKMGEFINSYQFELEAATSLEDLQYFKQGAKVDLHSESIEGTWQGTVGRISDRIDASTQTVKVFIYTSGKGLREGMYLTGTIAGNPVDNAISLERKLLDNQQQVFVVKDSVLDVIAVTPVRYSADYVVVKGIPDGTRLLDESVIGAYKGMSVSTY